MTDEISAGRLSNLPSIQRAGSDGYLMITSFSVSGFKCFEQLKLEGLTRINVITGANASGKSALLEALYIGAIANAPALQNIIGTRLPSVASPFIVGPGAVPMAVQPPLTDTHFDELFRRPKIIPEGVIDEEAVRALGKIIFSTEDSDGKSRSVVINFQPINEGPPVPVLRSTNGLTSPRIIIQRRKELEKGSFEASTVFVSMNQMGQLQQNPVKQFGPATMIFGPGMDYAESDDIAWFSQLREKNESEKVVAFLREEFPFLNDVQVLAPRGTSGLFGMGLDGTWRRITSISSGIYKIISILLASVHTRNGIILIDEIENGIYYEKYEAVWRILYKFARDTGNQIFVTSHSAECLSRLETVLSEHQEDFSLLRTERKDDECVVRHSGGQSMRAAIKYQGEIRGATSGVRGSVH